MFYADRKKWEVLKLHSWEVLEPYDWEYVSWNKVFSNTLTEVDAKGVNIQSSPTVFFTDAEMSVNIVVSSRDYKGVMLNYLPWYEKKSKVFDNILTAYDKEFRGIEQNMQVVERNMFIDTTIESLYLMERDSGIKNTKKLNYIQKREQIASRLKSVFDQTTEESIKMVANSYGNGEIEIVETQIEGVFDIKFSGGGIPNNIDGFKEAIDIVVPAHLQFYYEFIFIIWEQAKPKMWGELINYHWQEFMEIV